MPSTPTPRAWENVLSHLEQMLVSGEVRPGGRLPGERQLAAELGVGRSSVREALRVMEAMGLLRAQTGSGPTAGAMVVSSPSGGMSTLLRMQVAAQHFPVTDVVKTRVVLESAVVRDLAEQDPPAELSTASELLDAMDNTDLSATEYLILDAQFHLSLAEAAGNVVMAAMMGALRDSIEAYFVAQIPDDDWTSTCHHLQSEHRALLDAVEQRDSALAERRIVDHIRGYYFRPGSSDTESE